MRLHLPTHLPLGKHMHLSPHIHIQTYAWRIISLISYFTSVGIWLWTWDTATRQGGAGFSYEVTSQRIRRCAVCVNVSVSMCIRVCFHAHTFHTCQLTKATWEAIESCSSCGICYSNGVWLFERVYLCHSINTCTHACVIISACKNKRHWCVSVGSL